MADDGLLEAVRGLHLAHPELGPKPLLPPHGGSFVVSREKTCSLTQEIYKTSFPRSVCAARVSSVDGRVNGEQR